MNEELQFRTATLGGYHKQDVLNYIEMVRQEHAVRLDSVTKERDEALQDHEALETRAVQAEKARRMLERKTEELGGELNTTRQTLEQTQRELAQERRLRQELERRNQDLEQRLARAEPAAEAYENVKDCTAGIELQAHHRAKLVEAAAQEQVRRTKAEMQRWIERARAEYNRQREKIEETIAVAADTLEVVRGGLDELSTVFPDQDLALEALLKRLQTSLEEDAPQ